MAPVRAFRVALLAAAVACVNSASADSALAASRHSVRGSAAVDTAVVAASRGGAADLRSTAADLRATALWASLASSAAPPPEPLSCDACILVVSIAQQVAENKTTFNETLALIEQGCSVIGDATFEALCDALAEAMLSLLPFLDEQLKTLAWDIPEGFCSTFFPVCTVPCCAGGPYDPEQLHLSLTGVPGELQVEWVTYNDSASIVQWGPAQAGAPLPFSATGPPSTTYTNGGWVGRLRRATMTGLAPGAAYSYRVGDGTTWSAVVNITTIPANAGSDARPLRFAQLGDGAYDVNSDGTVAALTALVDAGAIDLVVFIGDLSYADGYERHWDIMGRKMQPIASRVPLQLVRGNHELWWNFTAFEHRFRMPPAAAYPPAAPGGDVASRYYSLDVGGVHLVLFDTETPEDTGDVEAGEVAWLRADLAAHANATWTVCGAHRPFYCTNGGATDKDCAVFAGVMRAQVEAVFVAGGADVVLGAHMHGYEATQAVNASRVVASRGPGGVFPPAPGAPVYVVNGAAGNREGNEDPAGDAAWSVPGAHSGAIGFAVLTASPRFLNVTFFAAAPDGTTTQIDFFAIPAN